MSIGARQPAALRFHPEIFVQGNLAIADEIIAPEFVWHAAGLPETPLGPEGVKQLATAYRAAFGNLAIVDEDIVSQGDTTAYRWILRGVHNAELLGAAPTGKQIEVRGFDLFHTRNGKLVEMWQVWDRLGFLQQVGATNAR